jgi:hypothetical protein
MTSDADSILRSSLPIPPQQISYRNTNPPRPLGSSCNTTPSSRSISIRGFGTYRCPYSRADRGPPRPTRARSSRTKREWWSYSDFRILRPRPRFGTWVFPSLLASFVTLRLPTSWFFPLASHPPSSSRAIGSCSQPTFVLASDLCRLRRAMSHQCPNHYLASPRRLTPPCKPRSISLVRLVRLVRLALIMSSHCTSELTPTSLPYTPPSQPPRPPAHLAHEPRGVAHPSILASGHAPHTHLPARPRFRRRALRDARAVFAGVVADPHR